MLSSYSVLGPGYLSYANPGVLERVAENRIERGWGLEQIDISRYDALVATEDCDLVGCDGWLITDKFIRVIVVDCQGDHVKERMSDSDLLADVNDINEVHKKGWLLLR